MLNFLYNFFFIYIHLTPPKPHAFVTNILLSTAGPVKEPVNNPVPGRRCPSCLDKGETVWVIPGKDCPQCGTSVNRVAVEPGIALLYNVIQTLILLSLIIITIVNNIGYINACIVNIPDFLINVPLNILGYINACIVNITDFLINLPIFNGCIDFCDAPRAWGLYFQDSASPQMEALVELHDNIMYYLTIILFGVGWIILSIVRNFVSSKSPISNKYLNHGTLIELIWTITPALILILIAFPSFKLLYLMDEVTDPSITLYAEGHQWYWSYQYPDFWSSDDTFIEFDSYLVPESDLEKGALRMLEVDNRVILPEITHTRFIIGAADVIHSFAIPALGIKCDAFPGRLNQVSVLINRLGTFYGQCSEICGILHSSMPIVVQSVSLEKFLAWLLEQ